MGPDSLVNGVRSPNGVRFTSEPNSSIEPSREKWVVQKFGGTSVGKFPLDIVDNVVRRVLLLNSAAFHASY